MEIDWSVVKKMTLWNYEDLIDKIRKVLSYKFIQDHYRHNMRDAGVYVKELLGYDEKYQKYIIRLTDIFKRLHSLRIENYSDLVERVGTKEKCKEFVRKTNLPFEDLISVLNYIFRWVLPFRNVFLRQLVDDDDKVHMDYIKRLREHGFKFNLDILEQGRTIKGREKLSTETGISKVFILDLVNRADLTRLPYMSKKTVIHLCNAGYDTIDKLATADVEKLRRDMKSYFNEVGIRLGSFIDIAGLAVWAETVPKIVEHQSLHVG